MLVTLILALITLMMGGLAVRSGLSLFENLNGSSIINSVPSLIIFIIYFTSIFTAVAGIGGSITAFFLWEISSAKFRDYLLKKQTRLGWVIPTPIMSFKQSSLFIFLLSTLAFVVFLLMTIAFYLF